MVDLENHGLLELLYNWDTQGINNCFALN